MGEMKVMQRRQSASGKVCVLPKSVGRGRTGRVIRAWRGVWTVFLLYLATAIALPAQTFTTLFKFNSSDGAQPNGPLVQGLDGNFYGTTIGGGGGNPYEGGTVFKITPRGVLTSLYSFCSQSKCADGAEPQAGLVQATDGNFYGTTPWGGVTNSVCGLGCGTVFKITPSGSLTQMYNFCAQVNCSDGSGPTAGLVQGTDGNFYGTTSGGGTHNRGTVFKITSQGLLTTLYNFCSQSNCADGISPSGLIQATDGNFYGTTRFNDNGVDIGGTVFKITPTGNQTTLYNFCCEETPPNGQAPIGGVVQGSDGNLYGTTSEGGTVGWAQGGTVFQITPDGTLNTLYRFCPQSCSPGSPGQAPEGGLVQGTDGKFYGTTSVGGAFNGGTIFSITSSGTVTVLYNFASWRHDYAGVFQATDGRFYGGTVDNAKGYYGTIFRLNMGLGAFVETLPTSGKVGAKITILATNLTGATAVSFNGKAATFTVVSSSEIKTTVPTGATTGTVTVTTPKGTLSSNVAFRVR